MTLEFKDLWLYILINGDGTCCWLDGLVFDPQWE